MPSAPRIEITELQRNALFHANFAHRDVNKNTQYVISLPTQGNRLFTENNKIVMSSSRRGIFTQLKNDMQTALIPGPLSELGPTNVNWFNRQSSTASPYHHTNQVIRSDRVTGIAIKIGDQWHEFPFTDGPIFFQGMLPEIYPNSAIHGGYSSQTHQLASNTYRANVRANRQRVNKVSTLCRKAADAIIEQLEALGVVRIQTYLQYVSGEVPPPNLTWNEGPDPEDDLEYNAATNDH